LIEFKTFPSKIWQVNEKKKKVLGIYMGKKKVEAERVEEHKPQTSPFFPSYVFSLPLFGGKRESLPMVIFLSLKKSSRLL
jgi:hypothetical protein